MEEIKTDFDEVLEEMAETIPEDLKTYITDDTKAEKALKKVKRETADRDRRVKIADAAIQEYEEIKHDLEMIHNRRIENLKWHLRQYFGTVPHRYLKASEQYELASGKLTLQYGSVKQKFVDDKGEEDKGLRLVKWLEDNGYEKYVKVTKEPAWGELKKVIKVSGEGWVISETGEEIDGIKAYKADDKFEVK